MRGSKVSLGLIGALTATFFVGFFINQTLLIILASASTVTMLGLFFSGKLIQRRMVVFAVAVQVFLDYKATQRFTSWNSDNEKKEEMWEACHKRNAERVFKVICELEGLWVKVGQFLSTRADVMPDPYIRKLKLLQDMMPPRPLDEVQSTIEDEMKQPLTAAFSYFDPVPLGTASIAQVHRATTIDGQDVVVKVQHKGVREAMMQDLDNLQTIVSWVAWSDPDFDFRVILNEWTTAIPKELDFQIEADNTKRVALNLDHRSKKAPNGDFPVHVNVVVPTILQSFPTVLVMNYCDGVRMNDVAAIDALGVDKLSLVESITRAYAHQIYIDGFFNADPHPGNFLVSRDPPHRPILLDFGLCKELRPHVQLALAKMLLATAEHDLAMLLSSFSEMGLKLRVDIPDDAMKVVSFFFRKSAPPEESRVENERFHREGKAKREAVKEKAKKDGDKSLLRNPVDAFPGELVFFSRVLALLRGVSSTLGTRVAYLEIMRPFAEHVLSISNSFVDHKLLSSRKWVQDSPPLSSAEQKVRALLEEMGQQGKILGIQVCVYKDGAPVVDLTAGVLGAYDPRPVQKDSLFSVFSATKGVTAGVVHWLVDQGKLRFQARVGEVWPEFSCNGKENCTVAHVLTHTSGLHNSLAKRFLAEPQWMCDWEKVLEALQEETPEHTPGQREAYHYLTYGWLAGGIVEKAAGKSFQKVLEESLTKPLGVEGEFYIGIPAGVESRLATLAMDRSGDSQSLLQQIRDAQPTSTTSSPASIASSADDSGNLARVVELAQSAASLPLLFNTLFIRRAVIPAANGHFSARALARYYAALADGGRIPDPVLEPENSTTEGLEPDFATSESASLVNTRGNGSDAVIDFKQADRGRLFSNPRAVDAFRGFGGYRLPGSNFGLGFQLYPSRSVGGTSREAPAIGHAGLGGSIAFCNPEHRFSIAVTLNKLSQKSEVASAIVRLVCEELGVPIPLRFEEESIQGPDMMETVM